MKQVWIFVVVFSYVAHGFPQTGLRKRRDDDIWLYQYPPYGPLVITGETGSNPNGIGESGRQNSAPEVVESFNAPPAPEFLNFNSEDRFTPSPLTPLSQPDFLKQVQDVLANPPDRSQVQSAFSQTTFPEDLPSFVKGVLTLDDFGRRGKSVGTTANVDDAENEDKTGLSIQLGDKWIWKG